MHDLKKHTMKDFLSITAISPVPNGLPHTYQLDSIVLHKSFPPRDLMESSVTIEEYILPEDIKPDPFSAEDCQDWLQFSSTDSGVQSNSFIDMVGFPSADLVAEFESSACLDIGTLYLLIAFCMTN